MGGIVTAVPTVRNQNELIISPNPAKDYIKVISVTGTQRISIFTMTGVKTKEFQLSTIQGAENDLYIGDLPSGTYLLKAQNINGQATVKKVIKRP